MEENTERVKRAIRQLCREYEGRSDAPLFFSPHLDIYPQSILHGDEWGMAMCLEMVGRCDEIVMLGRDVTSGMSDEGVRAVELHKKVTRRFDL